MRAAGAVAGGLCGLLCMYVTYAANGASYAPTPTKAAVMVTLLSCLSFVFSLYRFRYPRYWFAFTVATFRCGGGDGMCVWGGDGGVWGELWPLVAALTSPQASLQAEAGCPLKMARIPSPSLCLPAACPWLR
jgi:hypothetical protein